MARDDLAIREEVIFDERFTDDYPLRVFRDKRHLVIERKHLVWLLVLYQTSDDECGVV